MFLSLDGTFWIQLINFAIFFALLNVVFMRPVGEAIKRRRAYIDSVQSDLERHETQVRAIRAEAAQRRGAARRGADEAVARARVEAEEEVATLSGEAAARAAVISEKARHTVAAEIEAARAREGELAGTLAAAMLSQATTARS
jgi:F0F1-type ATP synthase membrane subunit b/b'